jgi:hypothetical protein
MKETKKNFNESYSSMTEPNPISSVLNGKLNRSFRCMSVYTVSFWQYYVRVYIKAMKFKSFSTQIITENFITKWHTKRNIQIDIQYEPSPFYKSGTLLFSFSVIK